ncbi:MAG TPA: SpoIIE family protein phosphatase [Streptosporangiaceae bacterium]|jgi:serine phosphatase RsbU (regulator of sigma subunit)/PAS domain-containing protein
MPRELDLPAPEQEITLLRARFDALRQSAAMPGAQLPQLLDAAFAELDGAIDLAASLQGGGQPGGPRSGVADAERQLLRAVFQDAPAPLFLLERDGTIRRANRRAAELLGSRPGYATGKLLTAFVDLRSRAAVQTQLAAAARTGRPRRARCSLLSPDGPVEAVLMLESIAAPQDPGLIIAVASRVSPEPPGGREPAAGQPGSGPDGDGELAGPARLADPLAVRAVEAITQRLDLVTAATRLLLENATFNESITLRQCARLLASELAAWVIVDVERRQRLRRRVVIGPGDKEAAELARALTGSDPQPGTVPWQVFDSGSSTLIAHAEDTDILGTGPGGVPLLMRLGATSLLSVPLSDGEHGYGVLTLARQPGEGPFEIADLGLVEELGEQLALAIKVDRMFRRRTEIADALQASLLPRQLPVLPGVEIAAAYVAATEGLDVGGDFYDVYPSPGGWGMAIGDVCGKGEEAAAVTAAARHAIRVLAHRNPDPAEVLRQANEIMLADNLDDRFVTACAVHLSWHGDQLRVAVGSAGHPGPAVVRPDGEVTMLDGGGMALGLFDSAEPGRQEIILRTGDLLFLYTDGVTEARSPEQRFFEERLTDHLSSLAGRPPSEICSATQALVLEFSMNDLRDDMTMLVLRAGRPPG